MADDAPDVLYHYTDFGGFSGIVQRRQLWATDIRYLNDAEELRFGAPAMANLLHHLADEFPDLSDADRAKCPGFFSPEGPDHTDHGYLGPKSAGLHAAAESIAAIADESLPQMPEGWRFGNGYVTCFTTEGDSLGQCVVTQVATASLLVSNVSSCQILSSTFGTTTAACISIGMVTDGSALP